MASGTKNLSAWETLRDLESADISIASVPDTKALLGSVGLVQSRLDRIAAAVNTRIDEHHRAGNSEDSESANRRSGKSRRSSKQASNRSKTLDKSPTLTDSLDNGDITSDHVDVVSNKLADLDPDTQQKLLDHVDELFGPSLDPDDVDDGPVPTPEKLRDKLARYLDLIDEQAGIDRQKRQERATKLKKWIDPHDGMYKGYFEFDPILGERVFKNIDAELEALWRQQHPKFDGKPLPKGLATNSHLAAQALANLTSKGRTVTGNEDDIDGTKANPGRRNTTDLIVLIDFETLRDGLRRHSICETANGTSITTPTARRLACEAGVIPAVLNTSGELLELGRKQRLATPAQRRALRILHPTCAFGTCGINFNHCHIHHVVPWEHGGLTDLVNLLPLCHKHHHLVHEGAWQLKLLPDRTLKIYRPNGEHSETIPPPLAEQTRARNEARDKRKPTNN